MLSRWIPIDIVYIANILARMVKKRPLLLLPSQLCAVCHIRRGSKICVLSFVARHDDMPSTRRRPPQSELPHPSPSSSSSSCPSSLDFRWTAAVPKFHSSSSSSFPPPLLLLLSRLLSLWQRLSACSRLSLFSPLYVYTHGYIFSARTRRARFQWGGRRTRNSSTVKSLLWWHFLLCARQKNKKTNITSARPKPHQKVGKEKKRIHFIIPAPLPFSKRNPPNKQQHSMPQHQIYNMALAWVLLQSFLYIPRCTGLAAAELYTTRTELFQPTTEVGADAEIYYM